MTGSKLADLAHELNRIFQIYPTVDEAIAAHDG